MTIRELAADLGLGKTTIARALQNSPLVNANTRALIWKRAKELGYTPNPVASAFLAQVRGRARTQYRGNLAYLSSLPPGVTMETTFYAQRKAYAGIAHRAKELGYGLEHIDVPSTGMNGARLTSMLKARGILGVIVGPLVEEGSAAELDWSKFAAVTTGYSVREPRLPRVAHNCPHGMDLVMSTARKRGLRRIGLMLDTRLDRRMGYGWSMAHLDWQRRLPREDWVQPLFVAPAELELGRVFSWLREQKPDAIIIGSTERTPLVRQAAAEVAKAPEILALEFEDDTGSGAGIDQLHFQIGVFSINLLSSNILHSDFGINKINTTLLVDGVWREG